MPRTGGIYYLPSPPTPFVAGTLASAEEVDTTLQDIAAALTGSLPRDGSAPLTGPLNLNGQNLSGVGTLTANSINCPNWVTCAGLNVTGGATIAALWGPLNCAGQPIVNAGSITSTAGRIISEMPAGFTNASVTVWDVSQNFAACMFLDVADRLSFGPADGSGNPSGYWGYFDTAGDFFVTNSLYVGVTVSVPNVVASGELITPLINSSVTVAGNLAVNGTLTPAAANLPGFTHVGGTLIIDGDSGGSHWLLWQGDGWGLHWYAADGALYFHTNDVAHPLMKLDRNGNLTVRGSVTPNTAI